MTLRVLDLFSGIGGFSLGLERAGMQTVAFCEIDPFCRKVLAKRWPNVPQHDDITTREFIKGEADVICGGFPCQDISLAGKRAGTRSGLYRELIRAIRVVRPKFAVLENVAALLSNGMGNVLGDLAEIGADAEWHCIPASAVGAPHRRDRVWIIADTRGEQYKGDRTPFSGALAKELSGTATDAAFMFGAEVIGNESDGASYCGQEMATPEGWRLEEFKPYGRGTWGSCGESWWSTEPDVGRMAYGIPSRVDRLRTLGNTVVSQIPELIGRAILQAEAA
jgi:DNA (cytosine-5)-methyltransferase 1